jgi:hypothetical protein
MSKENTITLRIKELDPDIIAPSFERMNKPEQGSSKIVIIGKPGCFAPGTEILMYDGSIKKVEDVIVGDIIMGDDGTPRNVLELCHDFDEMFKIIPIKGESYTVNKKHDLVLTCTGYNQIPKGHKEIISVEEYLSKSETWKRRFKLYRSSGVEWQHKDVRIDPYMLGLWLGDGTSATSEITNVDEAVINYIYEYADDNGLEVSTRSTYRYRIKGGDDRNTLLDSLKHYNLINNKHIPFDYKINSRQNRLKLLAGLIDTDGHADNCEYEIIQKNEALLDDIVFVARSLGFSAYKKKEKKSCMYKGEKREGDYYRCVIFGDRVHEIPVKIERKRVNERKINKNHLVTGFTVENIGHGEYFGFKLDKNHLFLLKSFDVVKNTGKSTLITSLLYAKQAIFSSGVVMSGTEDSNHHYSQMFPPTFVYNKLHKDKLEDFIKRQKLAKEHLQNPWSILLLDDCTDDPKLFNDPLFQGIFKNGRHWKMWFILSLQYCLDVKPVIRTNIDGTFILRETNLRNRRALWENYAGVIPDFSMFNDIMDQITNDYTALYIHNATTSNKLEDCIFWYKAKPVPNDFKVGCDEYWDFHNQRHNPNYKDSVI